MLNRTLIFVPTYNEHENARRMCEEIHKVGLEADVLFVDDNSPDGTGDILEFLKRQFPRLIVQRRQTKLGIGSAHLHAIEWAYDQGYHKLVTLDCDFSHSPSDIPDLIDATQDCDVSVGSRWMHPGSLAEWNIIRYLMTWIGHLLTKVALSLPQDATGGFRVYRLDHIPRAVFGLVQSRGYSFFFESLYILHRNAISICEVPIKLPARTYGHSKMSTSAALQSALYIFKLCWANLRRPEQFLVERRAPPALDPNLSVSIEWDRYWSDRSEKGSALYALIAGLYRRHVIKRNLNRTIRRNFANGSELLHAGCGGGQVDTDLQYTMQLTALDLSPRALCLYSRNNPNVVAVKHGDIFRLPFPDRTFDGVYNLGVVEHFNKEEIVQIFSEFRRVLRPNGKLVIFWPHAFGPSVLILRIWHYCRRLIFKCEEKLHPEEITYIRSRRQGRELLEKAALRLVDYQFGIADFFVQAVIVAQKL